MRPVSKILNETIANKYINGNFSLYFNKFIPLDESKNFKPVEKHKGDALESILKKYTDIANNSFSIELLSNKHLNQAGFLSALCEKYDILTFHARLKTRLVTGLGQTHPTETGMVFDFNIGIPYIPASSIKGLVRFTHRLETGLGLDESKDADPETLIPAIFGGQSKEEDKTKSYKGKVIFLDAYPESIPLLELDIMNPHYGPYYSDDSGKTPPGDWFDPVPIKFLTVAAGTIFKFRVLIPKDRQNLIDAVKKAYITALTQEGVGAKTAVGYGRFEIVEEKSGNPDLLDLSDSKNMTSTSEFVFYSDPDGTKEFYFERLDKAEKQSKDIEWLFQKWQNDPEWKTDTEIAAKFLEKIKKYKPKGGPTAFYKTVARILNIPIQ